MAVMNNSSINSNDTAIMDQQNIRLDRLDIAFLIQGALCLCTSLSLLIFLTSMWNLRGKNSHKFMMNLLTVHMLLCVTCIVMRLHPQRVPVILITGFLMQMFFSLILMTCDRFFAIEYPYAYQNVTTRKTILIIAASWMLSMVFVGLSFAFQLPFFQCIIASAALLLLASVSLAVANIKIYFIARRHARTINLQTVSLRTGEQKKEMRAVKATYVTFLIITTFILLWFPIFVFYMAVFMNVHTILMFKVAMQISCLEAVVDPILYVCCHRDVKRELRKVFNFFKKQKHQGDTIIEMI